MNEGNFIFSDYGISDLKAYKCAYKRFIDYCKLNFNRGFFSTYCDGEPFFKIDGLEYKYSDWKWNMERDGEQE